VEKIVKDFKQPPAFVGTFIGNRLKHVEGQITPSSPFEYERIYQLFDFIRQNKLEKEILKDMLPVVYQYPHMDFDSILDAVEFRRMSEKEILSNIPVLKEKFKEIAHSNDNTAAVLWIMGRLRPLAKGNTDLAKLRKKVQENCGGSHE
jgi:glutamyl-tRNA(Gln) amidotransferase subunit E